MYNIKINRSPRVNLNISKSKFDDYVPIFIILFIIWFISSEKQNDKKHVPTVNEMQMYPIII